MKKTYYLKAVTFAIGDFKLPVETFTLTSLKKKINWKKIRIPGRYELSLANRHARMRHGEKGRYYAATNSQNFGNGSDYSKARHLNTKFKRLECIFVMGGKQTL